MINQLLDTFKQVGLNLKSEEIADILWLALQIQPSPPEQLAQPPVDPLDQQEQSDISTTPAKSKPPAPKFNPKKPPPPAPKPKATDAPLYARTVGASSEAQPGLLFKAPSGSSLPESLQLAKSLRPFMRRVASHTETILDEVATAERIAEEKIPIPVLRPAPERWFDLALIIDDSPSMGIWQQTAFELQQLLERHGAFRHVQTWGLLLNEEGQICLRSGIGSAARNRRLHHPKELLDAGNQRLFLVGSDCVSPMWQDGLITGALTPWVKSGPLAIVQMLPEQLWERTALGLSAGVRFRALSPGAPNQKLITEELAVWDTADLEHGLKIPVVTLEPEPLKAWAKMVVGVANSSSPGFILELPEATAPSQLETTTLLQSETTQVTQKPTRLSAKQIVHRFLNASSPTARQLAGLLAAAPVISLPIVRLLRTTMLSQMRQVHVAEVFLGGLLKATSAIDPHIDPDYVQYDFVEPEVRSILLDASPLSNSTQVLHEVSNFIAERAGLSLHEFMAILEDPTLTKAEVTGQKVQPFARVTAQVLRRLGGDYVQVAERMEQPLNQEEEDSTSSSPDRYEGIVTPIGTLLGHQSGITSVAFSPDGQLIVSGSDDSTARLWDLQRNQVIQSLSGHDGFVNSVAFSPDGRTIVSCGSDTTIRLWDLQGNQIGQPVQGHSASVNSVAFSPDGQTIVSGSSDNTVRLWNLQGNPIGQPFNGHSSSIHAVIFSPDGQTIVSGSNDNTVRLWNLEGVPLGQPFQGHDDRVNSVAFSPNGKLLVSGSRDRTVRLWDLQGNSIGQSFQGHTSVVTAVVFSGDGQVIASGSKDNTIHLWDLHGQPLCQPLQGHQDEVWSVTFSPDGETIASSSNDETIRLWSLQPQKNDSATANEIQNRWAFLVGVNHYREGRRFGRLKHCINDVLALQDLLKSVGYGVVCLHDRLDQNDERYPDTAATVVAEFRRLCQKMGPDDLLLVYFACHGTRNLVKGDEKPYLIFRETRSTLPETALSITDFKAEMAKSPALRQVMLLDACHMGMETTERGSDTTADRQFIHNVYELATGFALLANSTVQQTTKESTELEHGVFSNFVLSGLAGQDRALVSATDPQKRFVSVNSLRNHVYNELLIWSAERGYDQRPQGYSEGDLGEFILVDYRHQSLPDLPISLPSSDLSVDREQVAQGEESETDVNRAFDDTEKKPRIPENLAPKQIKALHKALINAFPNSAELERVLLYQLEVNLSSISQADTYNVLIFELIQWAEASGNIRRLVIGVSLENPGNISLSMFIKDNILSLLTLEPIDDLPGESLSELINILQRRDFPIDAVLQAASQNLPEFEVNEELELRENLEDMDLSHPLKWLMILEYYLKTCADSNVNSVPFIVVFIKNLQEYLTDKRFQESLQTWLMSLPAEMRPEIAIDQLTVFLSPFLLFLLSTEQQEVDQARQQFNPSDWDKAQTIWERLQLYLDTQETLKLATKQVARKPESTARQTFLEDELTDLFQQEPELKAEITQILQDSAPISGPPAQITQGDGNQVIGQMSEGQLIGSVSGANVVIGGSGNPPHGESPTSQDATPSVKTILVLAANPKGTTQLRLDQEVRELQEGLQRARLRESYRIEQRWAVRPRDVQRALLDCEPQIVHFSGHGIGQENAQDGIAKGIDSGANNIPEGLMLEDKVGQAQLVSGNALASLFSLFDQIECVVLNACYSANQADAIARKIPYVIGMKRAIGDRAAIDFATGFYDALLAGQSVEFAYKLGCNAIQLEGIPEHLKPILRKRF